MKYESVNSQWPVDTNDGRDVIPTPQEAIAGARRLYRKAMGRAWRGPIKLTSGRNKTWIRRGVFYVNPNEARRGCNGGWHEIVHSVSHWASFRLHREAHGPRHAWIEKELIVFAVSRGFLAGALKRPDRPAPVKGPASRAAKLAARLKAWEAKRRRADRAAAKIRRALKRYESMGLAVAA